jgi:hypothetical protein
VAKRTIDDVVEQQEFFIQALDRNVNALAELVKVFKELSRNVALLADANGEMLKLMVPAQKTEASQPRKPKRPDPDGPPRPKQR